MVSRLNTPLLTFRGVVSTSALARVDLERLRLCAETMTNWMPQTLGPMSLRPGLGYLGSTKSDAQAKTIPFVNATNDTAVLEMTNLIMRPWVDDALITVASVSTVVTNGNMSSSAGWTTTASGGGTATFNVAVGSANVLELNCPNRGGKITVGRSVTVAGGDTNVKHYVRVTVTRGPVTFRIGTAAGDDSYQKTTTLHTGTHKLGLTPTGNFYVEVESDYEAIRYVDEIMIESAGTLELPTPWLTADLQKLRWDQSADVIFVACDGYQQRRIERRDNQSWSVCLYQSDDGPFTADRTARVRMRPGAQVGNTTLITDANFFKSTHVGAIFRIFANTQTCVINLAREDTYTTVIRVFGNSASERTVSVTITGVWVGTISLERSFDGEESGFNSFQSWTANLATTNIDLTVSGTEMWVRLGFRPNDYTSGTATVTLGYSGGGRFGVARVTAFTSATQVDCEILRAMATTAYSDTWREGMWSDRQGWPTSVAFYEGRLWWFGKNAIWGSVSDAYDSFDEETTGDSGPLNRTIGSGPVDNINWALGMQRLLIGTAGAEISIRSTSFDEPLTPTAFNLKNASTAGSSPDVPAVAIDQRGVFVGRDGASIWQLFYSPDGNDYESAPADLLWPEAGNTGIEAVAVQRKPDTRIHFVRTDGKVVILTWMPSEDVSPFVLLDTDGTVEDVCVLPDTPEDAVYYVVKRNINGVDKRFLERMALRSETEGANNTRLSDAFAVYNGASTTTPTGWSHLNGETVVVWADGIDVGTKVVSAGGFTLSTAASYVVAGLSYTAQFKSAKLAYGAQSGTALMQKKRIEQIGVVLKNTHAQGLEVGRDFDNMDNLPLTRDGADVSTNSIITSADDQMTAFPGDWDTDARLCMEAASPRPCTVLGVVLGMEVAERL